MPIYEYECLSCGKRIEILQRMNDAPPACPACGHEVKKLISSPAFHLKGSGWYATDH
ncbi:MAG TPA: FmdB family zinc ribbon protein, partial [Thermoanaerobaculia bacterium]